LAEDITKLEGFVGVNDIILDKIMYIIVERSKILTIERGITRVDQIWGDQGKHTLKD
jgi:predicted ATP-grasp superfamily ATP-dependent carboligase